MKGNLGFNVNGYIAGILSLLGHVRFKPAGGNLPGWSKPFPDAFFKNIYSKKEEIQNVFFTAHRCSGGKAEVWVGNHKVASISTFNHSKIWVISSVLNEQKALNTPKMMVKPLWPSRVPGAYKGDKCCAKFFSIGAGQVSDELSGWIFCSCQNTQCSLLDLSVLCHDWVSDPAQVWAKTLVLCT